MIWKSEKFKRGSARFLGDSVEEKIKSLFYFDAPTDAEPTLLTASGVLDLLGVEKNKANANVMALVLEKLVGKSQMCRVNGKQGRYYALPPRKADFL